MTRMPVFIDPQDGISHPEGACCFHCGRTIRLGDLRARVESFEMTIHVYLCLACYRQYSSVSATRTDAPGS